MDKIRVGFIGCGGNASSHVGRVLEMPEVEIVALCDVSDESIRRVRERHEAVADLPVFPDYRDLLAEVELDAVEISTPHTTHFEQIIASLERGAHVLTEKPMVCSIEDAKLVMAEEEKSGKLLASHPALNFEYGVEAPPPRPRPQAKHAAWIRNVKIFYKNFIHSWISALIRRTRLLRLW